jgi:hypothetical protein
LSLLPVLALIVMCIRLHVDVPFGDQWELVPRLDHLDAGTLTFNDVWRQHNEHRPMFPIVIMLGLAQLTSWNISAEIAVNVGLGIGILALCATALGRLHRGAAWRWWALPVISLLVTSFVQWENWLWGWQIQILLGVFAATLGLWLLSTPDTNGRRFAAALACGIVATYSFSSGLTYWILAAVPFYLDRAHWRASRIAIWTVVGAATIASYFVHYALPPNHPSLLANFESIGSALQLGIYLCKYLGGIVSGYVLRGRLAACAGAAALLVFVWLLRRNWQTRHDAAFIFPCVIGLNAIADAAMTALGRTGFGTNQALASRYTTIAEPLWIAIVLLVVLELVRSGGPARIPLPSRVLLSAAATLLLAAASMAALQGLHAAGERMGHLRALRTMLRDGVNWPALANLYIGDEHVIRERAGQLRMLRMSVYRE